MTQLTGVWGPLRHAIKQHVHYREVRDILSLAGFDMTQLAPVPFHDKEKTMITVDKEFGGRSLTDQERFVTIMAEEAAKLHPEVASDLQNTLPRLGWRFVEGRFLPLELLEQYDVESVPESAREDLAKAAERYRDGDLPNAVTNACGAVDSACRQVYERKGLGDPADAKSFQEKVSNSLNALGVLPRIERELTAIGVDACDAEQIRHNLKGALNQAARVMQLLRRTMSSAHGSKPALRPLAFDSLKWAMILTSLLQE